MEKRTRPVLIAVAAVLVIGVVAVVRLGGDDGDEDASPSTSSTTVATASTTTTSATPSPTTTSTTPSSATTPTTAPDHPEPPAPVLTVAAEPGGGSGEVVLRWDATPGATGYRVLRADGPGGTFAMSASIDVTDGSSTAADDVVNVFSTGHRYLPAGEPLAAPDDSEHFEYVELSGAEHCFQVVSFNTGGEAPASPIACASPP